MNAELWPLIDAGRFDEAIDLGLSIESGSITPPDLVNRGIAYLNVHQYTRAVADFAQADQLERNRGLSDSYRAWVATALWAGHDRPAAIRVWKEIVADHLAGRLTYSDAAGGVISVIEALFGGILEGDNELANDARRHLASHVRKGARTVWPSPLASAVIGDLSRDDLFSILRASETLEAARECEANFALAVAAEANGRCADAREFLNLCAGSDVLLKRCVYLARAVRESVR